MARLDIRFIIQIMPSIRLIAYVCLGVFLLSCTPARVETLVSSSSELDTMKPNLQTATITLSVTKTVKHTVPVPVTNTLVTDTPRPFVEFCTPLAEQLIQEIPEIISDPYNPPGPGKDDRHHGVDLAYYRRKNRTTIEGELVQAWLGGRVVAVVNDQLPYGNMVIIETSQNALTSNISEQLNIKKDESLYTLYAHFGEEPFVRLGEQVSCGQIVGIVGTTGYNIVNPHLHIETRIGPAKQTFADGMAYYDTRTTELERSNYELWRTSGVFRHFDPMDLVNIFLELEAGGY